MPRIVVTACLLLLTSCGSDGKGRVGALIGIEPMQDYRGVVSGFVDTFYHARFVADPEQVERAVQRLGLQRYRVAEADSAFAIPPADLLPAPGPRPTGWWRPDADLADGVVYTGAWSSPERTDSTYAIGIDPATGVTYVVIGYP